MKKITTIAALVAGFCGTVFAQDGSFPSNSILNPSMSLFRVSTAVGYESEYVFRGEQRADDSIQPKVEIAYPIFGFDLYCGTWMNFPIDREGQGSYNQLTEIDFYAGLNYSFGAFSIDFGGIYYWYPDQPYYMSGNTEVYVGLSMDTSSYLWGINLNPSVYYFYNFDLEQNVIEFSLGYELPIGNLLMGWNSLTMPLRGYAGWLTAERRNGDQDPTGYKWKDSYMYFGCSADIAYALTQYCTISGGVRFSYNDNGAENLYYDYSIGGEKNLWFGAKVDFGF